MAIPIIIDTDIGDDIDDALALALAVNSPELDLRGVTTVFRDAPRRSQLAQEILTLLDRDDIPVASGHSRPVVQPWSAIPDGSNLGKQLLRQPEMRIPESTEHAVEFLRRHILAAHDAGEKLTVVAIGPMTNIGLLFYQYPELAPLCKVMLMAGYFFGPEVYPEWNVFCDPEAAAMTLHALTETPGADVSFVGLDVTLRCVLDADQVQQFHDSPKLHAQFLGQLIKLWGHDVTLHDPLTVLALFDPCVTFERKRVEIALCGEQRGRTVVVDGEPNCWVATAVDGERAKTLFLERALASSRLPLAALSHV